MNIHVAHSKDELGRAAARDIARSLRALLGRQQQVRMVMAAAPSQCPMLTALRTETGIEWPRVTAFHMDEYIGLPADAPQRFANWLRREFADHIPLARFEPIDPGSDPQAECDRYAHLLHQAPIDLVLLGIGTNGHLAFNDPPADLADPLAVKVVTLDHMCREQQVLDGCFPALPDVPQYAITLTLPTLLSAGELFCCVPGRHKSAAVKDTLNAPVSGQHPSTALRTHAQCNLYLDLESNSAACYDEHSNH